MHLNSEDFFLTLNELLTTCAKRTDTNLTTCNNRQIGTGNNWQITLVMTSTSVVECPFPGLIITHSKDRTSFQTTHIMTNTMMWYSPSRLANPWTVATLGLGGHAFGSFESLLLPTFYNERNEMKKKKKWAQIVVFFAAPLHYWFNSYSLLPVELESQINLNSTKVVIKSIWEICHVYEILHCWPGYIACQQLEARWKFRLKDHCYACNTSEKGL